MTYRCLLSLPIKLGSSLRSEFVQTFLLGSPLADKPPPVEVDAIHSLHCTDSFLVGQEVDKSKTSAKVSSGQTSIHHSRW